MGGAVRGSRTAGAVLGVLVVALGLAAAPAATAQVIGPQNPDEPKVDSPWQAGTCTFDLPHCSVATPAQFFEVAGGHPKAGFTQFIVNTSPGTLGGVPVENLKTVRVDLPPGLTVNPQATPQCKLAPGESPQTCALSAPLSQVGTSEVTVASTVFPTDGAHITVPPVSVYNIEPLDGEPARFGFSAAGSDVFLEADVAWESDFHEYFTIHASKVELPVPGFEESARIFENRLVFDGMSGNGTFITTPTTCLGPAPPATAKSPFEHIYSTFLRADSYESPDPAFPSNSPFLESKIPPGTSPKRCEEIPFDPAISTDPGTDLTDSPAGAAVDVTLPEIKNPFAQATSHVRSAKVTLPNGMGLNPSAANGLQTCTNAQFAKGSRGPSSCPAASRVGTVEVNSPPLPDGSLTGPVYVGQQLSRDPTSGKEYRIFAEVQSARYDIVARLIGEVSADPLTGRLTTTFDDGPLGGVALPGLPQVPFKLFRVRFNSGAHAVLTSPPTCGPNTTSTAMTPWSSAVGQVPPGGVEGPSSAPPAQRSGSFELGSSPTGGACSKTMAGRPFSASFAARTTNANGGAFTHFKVDVARADGNQELKGINVEFPPGLLAKLAGVRYCPVGALNAAAASSGATEAANSSCPDSSLIGKATIKSGTGSDPVTIQGKAFLTGPYRGAPLSLAVVTPATAGPFDLGTVVVRVALFVDPRTAQVHVVPDPIPHVYGGALLDIRSVSIEVDRPQFTINPTDCSKLAVNGTLLGGGADPNNPATFSSLPVSSPFQVQGCDKLGFKPKLWMRLFGARRRAKNPKFRAVLKARSGDANIARASVTLPRALILDQASLRRICTRPQFAAHECPKGSIYGYALARTPLLDEPLKGPVYLRSSDNELPDLVADLQGQIDLELVGRIDSVKGHIRNTFDIVPDAPVSKFVLTMRGGKKGLLVNSRNLCKRNGRPAKIRALAKFKAHNGKKLKLRPRLRTPCGKKKHRKHKG